MVKRQKRFIYRFMIFLFSVRLFKIWKFISAIQLLLSRLLRPDGVYVCRTGFPDAMPDRLFLSRPLSQQPLFQRLPWLFDLPAVLPVLPCGASGRLSYVAVSARGPDTSYRNYKTPCMRRRDRLWKHPLLLPLLEAQGLRRLEQQELLA